MTAEITVEPLNCRHIGNKPFVDCRDVIPISEIVPCDWLVCSTASANCGPLQLLHVSLWPLILVFL